MSCDYNCFDCAQVNACNDPKRYINKRQDRKEYMRAYYQAHREKLLKRANERHARKNKQGKEYCKERGELMSEFKLKTLPEIARETMDRYVNADLDFEACVVRDPNTGDEIRLRWYLEKVEEDYKKYLDELDKWLEEEDA